jgi:hypothetical protein
MPGISCSNLPLHLHLCQQQHTSHQLTGCCTGHGTTVLCMHTGWCAAVLHTRLPDRPSESATGTTQPVKLVCYLSMRLWPCEHLCACAFFESIQRTTMRIIIPLRCSSDYIHLCASVCLYAALHAGPLMPSTPGRSWTA